MNEIQARFKLARPGFQLEVDLQLPAVGVTVLFGPSGCGKTTLLRCIAGLEKTSQGRLVVNGSVWQDQSQWVPVHKRPLGYVFQEASLFPHLTVWGNLQFGRKREPKAKTSDLDQIIHLLGIGPLLERKPERLSGGERQRVAIARALAVNPKLLIMDEPLAALDHQRKQEILPYLDRLHDELSIPVLYVTHSPDEMTRLADYLVLMSRGMVLASGPVRELLTRLDLPWAQSEEAEAIVDATVAGHDEEYYLTFFDFAGGRITVTKRQAQLGQKVRLRILAKDVSLSLRPLEDSSQLNCLPARVVELEGVANPGKVTLKLDLQGVMLLARVTKKSVALLDLRPGSPVFVLVKTVSFVD
ncbi:MAG: molybdenum ABC transporter ATP-binding protein [Candidatus Lambdaproteobacteria bacterium RIFOXYD1_FULL_56_27]|uniref:Molybdenum ABC transporter ATP-binding protein n=1 Tax=Candidatus Lambdaproteobacteria bacterium RIFOXYD2_FULL_56_26 TaxID=1817773 RepID=A0A1F6GSZ1_9PROT|nr:MAG: molybdenum ABC transporter ATP-binding protein [Candidatus Lambdaproteobacteria bacterium RIFOXYC1_FULL_56_13]OGH01208.1 MAG: molybdenum ABC transporter ATP-binding protein [Candidatus Lambdaproteobacteria bacterium RIFOXYD2_FULL_56_26]OGH06475.1 MAG: molybdenum ABC transporter ATP-binding protein [Candidatus Lambdaproteobacteria bacterium RIFOXYD1_FULL_56_27]